MKKILIIFIVLHSVSVFCQEKKAIYVKANALLLPVGILNAGLEYQLSERYTLQGDFLISPWKSFAGNHLQVYMGHLEGRYYFDKAFKHWYIGANAGFGLFDLTKYSYSGTNKFQRGFNVMLGGTVGYQMQWKERWNIDLFVGGGSSQGFYHGYESVPPNFIRYDGADGWNKSGEIIPYRGGVMLSYKIQ